MIPLEQRLHDLRLETELLYTRYLSFRTSPRAAEYRRAYEAAYEALNAALQEAREERLPNWEVWS